MTESDRDSLRSLQDRWLMLPAIVNHRRNHGDAERIAGPTSPTFGDVKRFVLPDWEQWFKDFMG